MIFKPVALEILNGVQLPVRGVYLAERLGPGKPKLGQPAILLPVGPEVTVEVMAGFGEIQISG
jgi:hypothetical protein